MRKICRDERETNKLIESAWGHEARSADHIAFPNERDLLVKRLDEIAVRNSIVRKIMGMKGFSLRESATSKKRKNIYIDFAPNDSRDARELEKRLRPLKVRGVLNVFTGYNINPGEDRLKRIEAELGSADLLVALISADYLASESCQRRLRLFRESGKIVIPVLLRKVFLAYSEIEGLVTLPRDGISIHSKRHIDAAWVEVIDGLLCALQLAPSDSI